MRQHHEVLVIALAEIDFLFPLLIDSNDNVPHVISQTMIDDQATGLVQQIMKSPIALYPFGANMRAVSLAAKFSNLFVVVLIQTL